MMHETINIKYRRFVIATIKCNIGDTVVIALLIWSWLQLKVFIVCAVICIHTSGLDMLNSET